MERRGSEISIQVDHELPDTYVVSKDDKFLINVTVTTYTEEIVREWIRGIQALYGKKNRRNIIVGFSARCSHSDRIHRKGSTNNLFYTDVICMSSIFIKDFSYFSQGEKPYDLLQLCVGSHCLLMEVFTYTPMARVVKEFLYDSRTVVVGVGIEKMAKKLEKEKESEGLLIRKRVDLRKEAEKNFPGNNFEKCSLEELAKVVLGGEADIVKPTNIKWWEYQPHYGRKLAKEMIKWASVEAFLACKMGSILLKDSL